MLFEKVVAYLVSIVTAILNFFGIAGSVTPRPQCIEIPDISYGSSYRQVVDLYIPRDASGDTGLVLYIHGGGWMTGNKSSFSEDCFDTATQKGAAAATMNYRYVSNSVDASDILDDIDSALSAIKERAAAEGVYINRVLLTGFSAGAHLSLLYAYSRCDTAPVSPVAVISNSGPTDLYDDNFYHDNALGSTGFMCELFSNVCGKWFSYSRKETAKEALYTVSPITYVSGSSVPTVINHGNKDRTVPFSNALSLNSRLTEYGVEHVLNVFEGADHELEGDASARQRADVLFDEYINRFLK